MNPKELRRLIVRLGEILEDINSALIELDPQAKSRLAKPLARLYLLMAKVDALRADASKGD